MKLLPNLRYSGSVYDIVVYFSIHGRWHAVDPPICSCRCVTFCCMPVLLTTEIYATKELPNFVKGLKDGLRTANSVADEKTLGFFDAGKTILTGSTNLPSLAERPC
jgi:hypothetical protein